MEKQKCPHCDKFFSPKGIGTHIWRLHGLGQTFNPNKGYEDGSRIVWNKGLTKDNNESVKKYSEKMTGREPWIKGKIHTNESKKKMSESAKQSFINGTHASWKTRNQRSYAEMYFEDVLRKYNLIDLCEAEYPIRIKGTRSSYFLDFYFHEHQINLEIDGSQHDYEDRKLSDKKRDEYLNAIGITVFRIKWYDPIKHKELLESQFSEFLMVYNKSNKSSYQVGNYLKNRKS